MFRLPNVSQENIYLKATLMRNRREKLMQIDNKYIIKVVRHLEEIDSFELDIPKFNTNQNGEQKLNQLYLKIMPRQQIIIESFDKNGNLINKERFVVNEKSRSRSKNKGNKTFKCYSFENTLKDKRCVLDNKVVQLKKDDVIISDGILDIFEKETKWGIKYIDPKSKVETLKAMDSVNINMFKNFTKDKVEEEKLIWEKSCSTNISGDKPLYLSIQYSNLKTFDEKGVLLKTETIPSLISEPMYTNIKKVQAYHHSEPNNRYGIRYVFTLVDNVQVERICTFTNVINKKITADSIDLIWETGEMVEKSHVKIVNISYDDSWFNVIEDVIQQFNSIIIYHSYEKQVSVIHKDNIGKNAPYVLSYDTNVISTDITENSSYPNALKVVGKDGLSIAQENIFGGDIIYDMDYYIKNGIMSDELQSNWSRYVTLLNSKQNEWQLLYNQKFALNQRKIKLDSEINALTLRIKYNKNLLNGYISSGNAEGQARIKAEIDSQTETLNGYLATVKEYQVQLDSLSDEMNSISTQVARENATDNKGKIFSDLDLEELRDIETVETYEDSYFSTPYGLLNEATKKLSEMLVPQIDFKINIKNLVQLIRGDFTKIFILGDLFKLDDEELSRELGDNVVRLVGYEFEPNKNKISNAIFSNKDKKYDVRRELSSIGRQVSSGSQTINNWANVVEDAKLSNNFVDSLIKGGLDLASQTARGRGTSNFITIDECGILLEDQRDRNKCMLISSGLIAISEDGFRTSKTAITPQAIIADVLAGNMVFGKKLMATSDTGVFEITGDGLTIYDADKKVRVKLGLFDIEGTTKAGLTLYSKDGKEVVLSEDGILNNNYYQVWDNISNGYPLVTTFPVDEGVSRIKQVKLKIKLENYRGFTRSVEGGGGGTTSGGSNNTTSSSGGDHRHLVFKDQGYQADLADDLSIPANKYKFGNSNSINDTLYLYIPSTNVNPDGYWQHPDIYTYYSSGNHSHSNPHEHYFNFFHNHPLNFGIFLGEKAIGCTLKVNGQMVRTNINADCEVDITQYVELNKDNIIDISSNTNGRVSIGVFSKMFTRF